MNRLRILCCKFKKSRFYTCTPTFYWACWIAGGTTIILTAITVTNMSGIANMADTSAILLAAITDTDMADMYNMANGAVPAISF